MFELSVTTPVISDCQRVSVLIWYRQRRRLGKASVVLGLVGLMLPRCSRLRSMFLSTHFRIWFGA